MNLQPSKDIVANRAYQIWEEAGRPIGLENAHWKQAQDELVSEARLLVEIQTEEDRLLSRRGEILGMPQLA